MLSRRDAIVVAVLVAAMIGSMIYARGTGRGEPHYDGVYRRGTDAWNAGRVAEAERILADCERAPDRPAKLAVAGECLALHGEVLVTLGRLDDARRVLERARRLLSGEDAPAPALERVLVAQASVACAEERLVECEALAREGLAVLERAPGRKKGDALFQLGYAQYRLGKLEEARRSLEASIGSEQHTSDVRQHASAWIELARVEEGLGNLDAAERHARAAFEALAAEREGGHAFTGIAERELARVAWRRGQLAEAERSMRAALARLERDLGDRSSHVPSALHDLGVILEKRGALDEASQVLRREVALRVATSRAPDALERARAALARVEAARTRVTPISHRDAGTR